MKVYIVTPHAKERMKDRGIDEQTLGDVMRSPDQIVPAQRGLLIYQSVMGDKLIRIVVEDADPRRVITVYKTSKISKYWKSA